VIGQISRVEVRFQQPEPEPPPMQYQHIDPATGENEYAFGALPAATDVGLLTAPSEVALVDRDPQNPATWGRIGRNEACPCGSGKKFKHCHGQVA
jgi:preprotein translocase subunit SecA